MTKNMLWPEEKKGKSDRKCFRCGDPNHLIGDCPKPSRNKDQKAFVGGSWSDSENDAEDKTNDETCLMAQSLNEVTLNSSCYSDNASSLDNDNMQIEYDSLCEISLKIINKNKILNTKRDLLEKEILELNQKIKKLERSKEIEFACKSCEELKLENAKLKETQVKFVKFDKSANSLREMLNNQKSPSCKIGLGSDNSKASTSETKNMSFVGSSAKKATDGSTIKAHGSTLPGSVSRNDDQKGTEHVFSPPLSSRSDFIITRKKLIHNRIDESKKPSLKPSPKSVEESLNVTFDESPPPTKLSPLVDDDVGEEEAIINNTKVVYNNNEEDESIEVDEVVNIKESKNHPLDQVIGNLNQRTLRSQAQDHSNFFCFISTIEPKNVNEALKDESWVVAMQEELNQFDSTCLGLRKEYRLSLKNDMPLQDKMDDRTLLWREYIRLERRKKLENVRKCLNGKLLSMVDLNMALSLRDQRHQYLRFEGLQYTEGDIADFEMRLAKIYKREVHWVQVHAEGRKSGARLSGGHFIGRLAHHFGLPDATAGAPGAAEDAPAVDEGAQANPVPVQAP
ncbi:zf-CCHC domain-containing protein [Tanacetum coccineum]